jgi:uncharacterized surface protein with fasciclin (FAS1) repeats
MSGNQTLTKTIESIDMFSVFARLMRTSRTNEFITDGGPFTIFVPTNDAFGQVPDRTMNAWTSEPDQMELAGVLAYHIVARRLMAASLGGSEPSAFSISGKEMRFTDACGLKVNGCSLLARNIEATNGIIHAIDAVLSLTSDEVPSAKAMGDLGSGPRTATLFHKDVAKRKLL